MNIHTVLTQSRVHFSSALLDFMFCRATAVADTSAHLLVSVRLWTVGQTVTGLPAVKTKLEKKRRQRSGSEEQNKGKNSSLSGSYCVNALTMLFFLSICLLTLLSSLLLSFFRAVCTSSLSSLSSSPAPLSALGSGCPVCWRYSRKPFTSSSTYSFFLRLGFFTAAPPGWVLLR